MKGKAFFRKCHPPPPPPRASDNGKRRHESKSATVKRKGRGSKVAEKSSTTRELKLKLGRCWSVQLVVVVLVTELGVALFESKNKPLRKAWFELCCFSFDLLFRPWIYGDCHFAFFFSTSMRQLMRGKRHAY